MSQHTSKQGIAYTTLGEPNSPFGLVLVHGWGCQKSDFDGLLEYISNKQRNKSRKLDFLTVCPDLPGHGSTSQDVCPTPSMAGFAEILISLIEELGLRDVVLVGHSMGVRIVTEIWKLLSHPHPSQTGVAVNVRALIFIDGSHHLTQPSISFDKITDSEVLATIKARVFQAMFSPKTPEAFKLSTIEHVRTRDDTYQEKLRDNMVAYGLESMAEVIEKLEKDGRTRLLNLQSSDTSGGKRVALKEGEKSEWMRYLEETVPQARQGVVEDSAHFPHVDWPEVVGERIWELVEEVRNLSF